MTQALKEMKFPKGPASEETLTYREAFMESYDIHGRTFGRKDDTQVLQFEKYFFSVKKIAHIPFKGKYYK